MDGIQILNSSDIPAPDFRAKKEHPETRLLGELTPRQAFDTFPDWVEGKDRYQPQPAPIEKLRGITPAKARIFFGAWCPDCHVMVPRFFKIIEKAELQDRVEISLCAVDRSKRFPADLVSRYGIKFVPTFIFERDDREIGRIVETPSSLYLEEDLWHILKMSPEGYTARHIGHGANGS